MARFYGKLWGKSGSEVTRTGLNRIDAELVDKDMRVQMNLRDMGLDGHVLCVFAHRIDSSEPGRTLYNGPFTADSLRRMPPETRAEYEQIIRAQSREIDAQKREIERLQAQLIVARDLMEDMKLALKGRLSTPGVKENTSARND